MRECEEYERQKAIGINFNKEALAKKSYSEETAGKQKGKNSGASRS